MFSSDYDYLKNYELYEKQLSLGDEFYRNERNYNKLNGNYRNAVSNIRNILLSLPLFKSM
ncbi:hypothetical protein M2651_04585 [Clostridium sp. SYSU_GA19001]|uniref:hypothetical protein n=1 Tax=Clostridium caldaquaticum TaxID=2940653 RepID=UPI0020777C27|nr:hypothetical protein [Clostridium caldaquaticum]MCM8710302.1 hypothetical protein [Clostridium caldaquaticum]